MGRTVESIRIRVTSREDRSEIRDAREAFWAPLRQTEEFSNRTVGQMEAKLCREFGFALQNDLIEHLSKPLEKHDSELFPNSLRDFERWMFHYPPEKEWYRYQAGDVLKKFLEYGRDELAGSPAQDSSSRYSVKGITCALRNCDR